MQCKQHHYSYFSLYSFFFHVYFYHCMLVYQSRMSTFQLLWYVSQLTGKCRARKFVARNEGEIKFTEEELKEISDLKRGPNFIQVTCGCTHKKKGDYTGRLRINSHGHFMIKCTCYDKCTEGKSLSQLLRLVSHHSHHTLVRCGHTYIHKL